MSLPSRTAGIRSPGELYACRGSFMPRIAGGLGGTRHWRICRDTKAGGKSARTRGRKKKDLSRKNPAGAGLSLGLTSSEGPMEPVLDRQRGSRLLVPLPSDKKTAQQRPGRGCAPARQLGEQALTAA